jgi:uncharacterized protein (TIGR02271 family)
LTATKAPPEVVPVLEETIRVEKTERAVDRMLINTSVRERTENVDLDLRSMDVVIERVPINRVVEAAPSMREEGDTIIIPILEEIVVVEKRLILKEEVHIRRRDAVQHVHETVQLRSQEVSLERVPINRSPQDTNTEDQE